MRVAKLDRILRQKDEGLRKAVEAATQGRIAESLALLKAQGRLHEIPNRAERLGAMARDFAAAPDSALLLSPDNQSRHDLNAATRAQLRHTGKLTEASFDASILLPRQDVTGADRQRAASYRPGDTVWYRKGSSEKGIAAKSYTRVVAVDPENNLLTVRKQNGGYRTYDPSRLHGVSVYQSAERSFSVGDRIQFLQKWDAKGVNTRDRATITDLDRHGNITVRTEETGQTIRWNLSQNRHIDYAYAMTSYSAQAATVRILTSGQRVKIPSETRLTFRHREERRDPGVGVGVVWGCI